MIWANGSLFHHLRRAVIFGFLLALAAGIFLPVYTDEVGWRFQERAWIDGVDKLYSDQCGPNTLAIPPLFMWPARWFSAFFNTHFPDPLFVRVSGVLYAMAFVWLVLRLIRQIGRSDEDRDVLAIIAAALMGLGVTPLLLVWSRPEQPILLAITTAILIASGGWRSPGNLFAPFNGIAYAQAPASPGTAWRRSLLILTLALVALSYHFKAVLVAPAFIACICFASRGRRSLAARGIAIALLLLATGSAAKYWVTRLECPNDPIVAKQHARQNLGGQMITGSVGTGEAVLRILGNYHLESYVNRAAPSVDPMSSWLPIGMVSNDETRGWRGGMTIIWALALIAGIASFVSGVRIAIRDRVIPPEPIIALMLFGGVSIWCVSQITRNAYEASFVLPLLMLAIVLSLSSPHGSGALRQWLSTLALAIGPLMLLSIVLVSGLYGPTLLEDATERDFLPMHPWSVPVFGYHQSYRDIAGVARDCHLPPTNQASNLLLDDITYFAFMRSQRPQHELAILSPQWRGSITDPIAYLRDRQSSGIILRCRWLPKDLQARAHQRGAYCCLAPADWPTPSAPANSAK